MDELLRQSGEFVREWGPYGLLLIAFIALTWFRETKTIPKMIENFTTEIAAERAASRAELAVERAECNDRHRELVALHQAGTVQMAALIQQLHHRLELTQHSIRNLTHAAKLKSELRKIEEDQNGNGDHA